MEGSSFGMWLKQRRKALGLTQSDLTDRIGCAIVTVKKLETAQRRPSPPIVERIAAALGVPSEQRPALLAWARAASDAADLPLPLVCCHGPGGVGPGRHARQRRRQRSPAFHRVPGLAPAPACPARPHDRRAGGGGGPAGSHRPAGGAAPGRCQRCPTHPLGHAPIGPERAAHAEALARLRATLGPEEAALGWQRGGRLALEQAVEIALAALEQSVEVGA